jgi:two-component system response regulator HydG
MVSRGMFREDLYYRLKVVAIQVPTLRQRSDDIVPMARFFLQRLAERGSHPPKRLSRSVMERLINYPWPGNARELFNAMEHAAIFAEGSEIQLENLPAPLFVGTKDQVACDDLDLESVERGAILRALRMADWNRTAACRLLHIELRRLNRRMKHLGIEQHSL